MALVVIGTVVGVGAAAAPAIKGVIGLALRVAKGAKAAEVSDGLVGRIRDKVELLALLLTQLEENPKAKRLAEPYMQTALRVLEESGKIISQYTNQNWLQKFFHASEMRRRMEDLDRDMVMVSTTFSSYIAAGTMSFSDLGIEDQVEAAQEEASAELEGLLAADPHFAPEDFGGPRAVTELQLARGETAEEAVGIMPAGFLGRFHVVSQELLKVPVDQRPALANCSGNTYALLHQAVFWNSLYGVLLLLDNKANINAQTKADDRDLDIRRGSTALHLAVVTLNVDIVKVLLSRGADPQAKNEAGQSPEDVASLPGFEEAKALFDRVAELKMMANVAVKARGHKWVEMFNLINETGANPNMKHPGQRYYCLHQAAEAGKLDVCVQLICAGALPTLRTMYSDEVRELPKLPSELATEKGYKDCAAVLADIERQTEARMAGTQEPQRGRRRPLSR